MLAVDRENQLIVAGKRKLLDLARVRAEELPKAVISLWLRRLQPQPLSIALVQFINLPYDYCFLDLGLLICF